MDPNVVLVNNALLDTTSKVNEPLVPIVTPPVMVLVLLLSVLVVPSFTTCARISGIDNANATNKQSSGFKRRARTALSQVPERGCVAEISRSASPAQLPVERAAAG